jgi:hypothetical protein
MQAAHRHRRQGRQLLACLDGFQNVACGRNCGPRFGGSTGEVHVYSDDAATIERSIVTEVRGQYPQVGRD